MIEKIKSKLTSYRKILAKALFDKKTGSAEKLNPAGAKNILFLRTDGKIGDMVVSTLVFRELKKCYPGIGITVLCTKDNKEIIKRNVYVDDIILLSGKFFNDLKVFKSLKNKKIDIVVDFTQFRPRPKQLFMIRSINPGFLIGFNKSGYKTYDLSINCDVNKLHISKRYELLLNALGVIPLSFKYDVFTEPDQEKAALETFKKGKNNILINPFAASRHRTFSLSKLQDLLNRINGNFINKEEVNVFVICPKRFSSMLKGLYGAKIITTDSVLESAAYVKFCDCVITPDTSIVHIAAAFNKKMLALYLDDSHGEEKKSTIWDPNYDNAFKLTVPADAGLKNNDIKNIDNKDIEDMFRRIMGATDKNAERN